MKKILILFFCLFTVYFAHCQRPQALTTLERSLSPNMMMMSNDSRYASYKYFSDWLDIYADSLNLQNPFWMGSILPSQNVSINAAGNNLIYSAGGINSWSTTANAGNWSYFKQVNPLTNTLNFYGIQGDSTQYVGLRANTLGLTISSITDLAFENDQVQQGLLPVGTYLAEFDEGGVLNFVESANFSTWLKPQMEAGNNVTISSANNLTLSNSGNFSRVNSTSMRVQGVTDDEAAYVDINKDRIQVYEDGAGGSSVITPASITTSANGGRNVSLTGFGLTTTYGNATIEVIDKRLNIENNGISSGTSSILLNQPDSQVSGISTGNTIEQTAENLTSKQSYKLSQVGSSTSTRPTFEKQQVKINGVPQLLDGTHILELSALPANNTASPKLILARTNLSSPGANFNTTYAASGNELGQVNFADGTGNTLTSSARIVGYATEQHTASAFGSELRIGTTANGATTQTDNLGIGQSGNIIAYQYGQGNKEASDLSKTPSSYITKFATDGTYIEYLPVNAVIQFQNDTILANTVKNMDGLSIVSAVGVTLQSDTAFVLNAGRYKMDLVSVAKSLSSEAQYNTSIDASGISAVGNSILSYAPVSTSLFQASPNTFIITVNSDNTPITLNFSGDNSSDIHIRQGKITIQQIY